MLGCDSHIKSICGVPLKGTKLVRVTYIDESGVSPREPQVTVAAVLIDGNDQLTKVENELEGLIQKFIPPEQQDGFYFHAADIFSGNDIFKDRDVWPTERRFEILDALANIIVKNDLPISFGSINKEHQKNELYDQGIMVSNSIDMAHGIAFALCCGGVELCMRAANENTMLIAEHRNETNDLLKEIHKIYRSSKLMTANQIDPTGFFPYERIKNGLVIAKKDEAHGLQLADFCAFVIRSKILGNSWRLDKIIELYERIIPQSVWVPHINEKNLAAE